MSKDKIILYEEKDNGYVGLSWEPFLKKWILHLEFKKWSPQNYKRYLKIFNIIKKHLKARGITEAYGLAETLHDVKLNEMFGAYNTGNVAIVENKEENYITKCVF